MLEGHAPRQADAPLDFDGLLQHMVVGGWPTSIGLTADDALAANRDYVDTIIDVNIDAVGRTRDPLRVRRLLQALARSTATEVSISTLARDEATLSRDAVREYLDALTRIFIVENQPAWSAHLRSSAILRKEPKRHLCDTSLAAALVGADAVALRRDLEFAGQLFESQAIHDLRVFAQPLGGEVYHARDSAGREVAAIIQLPDGRWAGFEVTLGAAEETVDGAAETLRNFAANVSGTRAEDPVLAVITGTGPSYRRADGVNVIALSSLGR